MENILYIKIPALGARLIGYTSPGWYFWDEVYYLHGPYDTEEEAMREYKEYVEELNREQPIEELPSKQG